MSKQEVERLTTKLEELEIKQINLTSEIEKAKKEIQKLRESELKEEKEVVSGSKLYQGGIVTILNPTARQANKGVVYGVTKDGLIKIQPKEGKTIRKLPKNVKN